MVMVQSDQPCMAGTYPNSTVVVLTASPSLGYQFEKWSGDIGNNSESNISISVVMDKDRAINAGFIAPGGLYIVTVDAKPGYGGSVIIETPFGLFHTNASQTSVSIECVSGTTINITAVAAEDYRFDRWKGGITDHRSNMTFVVNSSETITAEFSMPLSFPWIWISIIIAASVLALLSLVWLIFGATKRLKRIPHTPGVEQRTETIQEGEDLKK